MIQGHSLERSTMKSELREILNVLFWIAGRVGKRRALGDGESGE